MTRATPAAAPIACRIGISVAIAVAAGSAPASAAAPRRSGTTQPRPPASDARFREPDQSRFWRCTDEVEPCHRPGPARALLLSLGVLGGGLASGLLFALGDRLAPGDPATLLVGTGALAGAGALVGFAAGRLGADRDLVVDRVRPATAGLAWTLAQPRTLDEVEPHALSLNWAPTWRLDDYGSRVRLIGHFGGWANRRRQVDPRPQVAGSDDALEGTAPRTFSQRRLSAQVGLDVAIALPYPVLRAPRRSAFLGPAQVRWRPTFDIRRESYDLGGDGRIVERTMLLPLTAGARWQLSPRQRFTFYVGPRFDLIAYEDPMTGEMSRGRAALGPLHAEAWYDIDVTLTEHPRRDGKARKVEANSMLTLGYVHSRFDGLGFNFGPVIGFLGPLHAQWQTKIRPRGSKVAVQAGATARIGDAASFTLDLGIVAPDLGPGRRRR